VIFISIIAPLSFIFLTTTIIMIIVCHYAMSCHTI
jgi:hypothetical protein